MMAHSHQLLFLLTGPLSMWSEHFPSHCAAVSPVEGKDCEADNATKDLELVFIMVITTYALQSSKYGGGVCCLQVLQLR